MEAARRSVTAAAELTTGVKLGVDDLNSGEPDARDLIDRDSATVVLDEDGAVRQE